MKTAFSVIGLLTLGGVLLTASSDAATYAGQFCQSRTPGVSLTYTSTGATNNSGAAISISCPLERVKDLGTAAAGATIYFFNDGINKTCYFDNFNIDTGALGIWTSATGTTRLVPPTLTTTLQYQPFTLNCSLPAGGRVHGYYLGEI